MIQGLSYGAYAPSIEMRSRMARNSMRKQVERRAAMHAALEFVHPGNLGALPPSPEVLVRKAVQIGLVQWEEVL